MFVLRSRNVAVYNSIPVLTKLKFTGPAVRINRLMRLLAALGLWLLPGWADQARAAAWPRGHIDPVVPIGVSQLARLGRPPIAADRSAPLNFVSENFPPGTARPRCPTGGPGCHSARQRRQQATEAPTDASPPAPPPPPSESGSGCVSPTAPPLNLNPLPEESGSSRCTSRKSLRGFLLQGLVNREGLGREGWVAHRIVPVPSPVSSS